MTAVVMEVLRRMRVLCLIAILGESPLVSWIRKCRSTRFQACKMGGLMKEAVVLMIDV